MLLFLGDWRLNVGKVLLVVLGAIILIVEIIINKDKDMTTRLRLSGELVGVRLEKWK